MTDASALTATPSPLKKKKVLKVCVRRSPNTGKDELSSSSHHRRRIISRSSDDALPSLDISCHSEASVESLLQHDLGGNNKNSHHQQQGPGGEDTASVDSSTPSLKRLAQHAAARRRTRADSSENNHQRPRRRRSRSRSRSKSRDRRTTSSSLDKINSDYNTMMKESESNIKNRKNATSTADTSISQATLQLMATSLEDAVTSATATAGASSSRSSSASSFSTNDKVKKSDNRRTSAASSSSTESSPVSLFSLEEVERQLECVSWYHRLGSPPKDIFCQRIEKATNGRLTAQDVQQLPWKKSNSFIDVAVVNARVRQAHKQKQQQRKR